MIIDADKSIYINTAWVILCFSITLSFYKYHDREMLDIKDKFVPKFTAERG